MDAIGQQPAVSASATPWGKRKRKRSKTKNRPARPSNKRRRLAKAKLKEAREGASSPTLGTPEVAQPETTATQSALLGSRSATGSVGGAGGGDRAADALPLARHHDQPPIRLRSKGNNSTKTCVEDLHMAMATRYNMVLTCTRADVDAFIVNKLGLELGKGITGPEEGRLKDFLEHHGYRWSRKILAKRTKIEQTQGCDKADDVRRFCASKGLGMYHVTTAQNPGYIQHVIAVHVQRYKSEYFEDGEWHPLDKLTYIPETYVRHIRRFVPRSDKDLAADDVVNQGQSDDVQHVELIDLTTSDCDEDEDSGDDDDDEEYVDGDE